MDIQKKNVVEVIVHIWIERKKLCMTTIYHAQIIKSTKRRRRIFEEVCSPFKEKVGLCLSGYGLNRGRGGMNCNLFHLGMKCYLPRQAKDCSLGG
jgi:hypothetical protein